jgi:hypothetical protein
MADDDKGPRVVELPRRPLSDVPGHLRKLADDIERGEYGDVRAAIVVIEQDGDGGTVSAESFGFGSDADPVRAAGLLHFGISLVTGAREPGDHDD